MKPRIYDTYDTSYDASYDACFPAIMRVVTLMTLFAHAHTYAHARTRHIYLCVICVISVINSNKLLILLEKICDGLSDGSQKLITEASGGGFYG